MSKLQLSMLGWALLILQLPLLHLAPTLSLILGMSCIYVFGMNMGRRIWEKDES